MYVQEMRVDLGDSTRHPWVEHHDFRMERDPANAMTLAPYGNAKFQTILAHVFKSKRGVLTPADVAFAEVCVAATLSHQTLMTFDDAEGYCRQALLFAKDHLGRHSAILPPGSRPVSFSMGARYCCLSCCRAYDIVVT